MAKKPLLSLPINAQPFQICKEVQKPCCGRGPGWLSFLEECPKYFFFQLPKLNKGDKKAQTGSFVGLHPVSQFMPQRLQNVIKKNKKGMPVTEILNTCTW